MKNIKDTGLLLNVPALAKHLGLSRYTIYKWTRAGMPTVLGKAGKGHALYRLSDVHAWFSQNKK